MKNYLPQIDEVDETISTKSTTTIYTNSKCEIGRLKSEYEEFDALSTTDLNYCEEEETEEEKKRKELANNILRNLFNLIRINFNQKK